MITFQVLFFWDERCCYISAMVFRILGTLYLEWEVLLHFCNGIYFLGWGVLLHFCDGIQNFEHLVEFCVWFYSWDDEFFWSCNRGVNFWCDALDCLYWYSCEYCVLKYTTIVRDFFGFKMRGALDCCENIVFLKYTTIARDFFGGLRWEGLNDNIRILCL